MMKTQIKIGSRSSPLAVVQVDEIFLALKDKGQAVDCERLTFKTKGDKDLVSPLTDRLAENFFTDSLDQALLNHEIDLAVHSAKDLPEELPEGLSVFALTKALDERDAFVGNCSFDHLPDGARIGTSSDLRQKQIKDLNAKLETPSIRGNIQERIEQMRAGQYDGLIVAACALKRLGQEDLIQDMMPWEATPLQGQLAVVGRTDDFESKKMCSSIDVRKSYGRVVLVGAGPGDPELITVKGVKALRQAETVFYDYLAHPDLLDYAPGAKHIYAGKRKGAHSMPQDELCRQLKEEALAGKNIVRLKGGDPLIFGRGADEISYLRAFHIIVEIVPGLTAATALPSLLGIPLTARKVSSSVALISGHGHSGGDCNGMPDEIPKAQTVIVYMGLTRIKEIMDKLIAQGWDEKTPVMVISRGSGFQEKVVQGRIATIEAMVAQEQVQQPALIMIGNTVSFYKEMKRPGILYFGTCPEKYQFLGRIIHHPMIEISGKEKDDHILKTMENIDAYDLILFTSRFGVRHFFRLAGSVPGLLEKLSRKEYAVIGKESKAALECCGITAKLVSPVETSEGMFDYLKNHWDCSGQSILFPRSSLSNPYLRDQLTQAGSSVEELIVYENTKPSLRALPEGLFDAVFFSSPSTVRNFLEDYQTIPSNVRILAKGPRTQSTLISAGYPSADLIVK